MLFLSILFALGFAECAATHAACRPGEQVSFVAFSNKKNLRWNYLQFGASIYVRLYNGDSVEPKYRDSISVRVTEDTTTLTLNATKKLAGVYAVFVPGDETLLPRYFLTILTSKLFCSTSEVSHSHLQISCFIEYLGDWPPIIKWHQYPDIPIATAMVYGNNMANSTTIIPRRPPHLYQSTLLFDRANIPDATNAAEGFPSYTEKSTWHSFPDSKHNGHDSPKESGACAQQIASTLLISIAWSICSIGASLAQYAQSVTSLASNE